MKKKIMICDDQVIILELLSHVLADDNIEVIQTSKSTELLSLIDNTEPDLLIIDFQMPNLTGDQIVRELKRSEKYKQLPVIMVSASVSGEMVALECGADAFLAKPFDLKDLYLLVEKIM